MPAPASFIATAQQDAPLSWWRLAECPGSTVAVDIGSSPANGTILGGSGFGPIRLGAAGGLTNDPSAGIDFEASSGGGVSLGTPSSLTSLSDNFSVKAEIKIWAPMTSGAQTVFSMMNGWTLYVNYSSGAGGGTLQVYDWKSATSLDTAIRVDDGNQHSVGYTKSGTTLTIYLDGTGHPFTINGATNGAISGLYLGCGSTPSTQNFNGVIHDAMIITPALSAARFTAHWQATGQSGGYSVNCSRRMSTGVPWNVTVTLRATSTTTVTLSDNGAGGTFGSTTLAFTSGGATTLTTTYTPAAITTVNATIKITSTNNNSLPDPQGNTVVVYTLPTGINVTAATGWLGVAGTGFGNISNAPISSPARATHGQVALQIGEVPRQDISGVWQLPILAYSLNATQTGDATDHIEVYCEGSGVKIASRSLWTIPNGPISAKSCPVVYCFVCNIDTTMLPRDGSLQIYVRAVSSNAAISATVQSFQISANNFGTRPTPSFYISDSLGNDSTGNGTVGTPYKNITRGIDAGWHAGDVGGTTCLLMDAPAAGFAYGNAVENAGRLSLGRWVTLTPAPGYTPTQAKIGPAGSSDGVRTQNVRFKNCQIVGSAFGTTGMPSTSSIAGQLPAFWVSDKTEWVGAGRTTAGNPIPFAIAAVWQGGGWYTDFIYHDSGSCTQGGALARNCLIHDISGVAYLSTSCVIGGDVYGIDQTGTTNHSDGGFWQSAANGGIIVYGTYIHDNPVCARIFAFNSPGWTVTDTFIVNNDAATANVPSDSQYFDFGAVPNGESHVAVWENTIPQNNLLFTGTGGFSQDYLSVKRNVLYDATDNTGTFTAITNTNVDGNWTVLSTATLGTKLGSGAPQWDQNRIPLANGNLVTGAGAPIIAYDRMGNARNATSAVGAYEVASQSGGTMPRGLMSPGQQ